MITTSKKGQKYLPYVFTTNDAGEVTNSAWGDPAVGTHIAEVCYSKRVNCWLWPEWHSADNQAPGPVGYIDTLGNIAWLEN